MDKSNGKDWFSKTLNSVTEESAKAYSISKNSIEVLTLKKSISERKHLLLEKLMKQIESGVVDQKLFEPEYSKIKKLESDIERLGEENKEIKSNSVIPFDKVSVIAEDVATESKKIAVKIKDSISDSFNFDNSKKG